MRFLSTILFCIRNSNIFRLILSRKFSYFYAVFPISIDSLNHCSYCSTIGLFAISFYRKCSENILFWKNTILEHLFERAQDKKDWHLSFIVLIIVCSPLPHLPHFWWGGSEQEKKGGLTGPQLWEGVTFFRGVAIFTKKNKVKSEMFYDKKSL